MKLVRLNVWCAVIKSQLVGVFFFIDDTANGESYPPVLQGFFISEITKLEKHPSSIV